VIVSRRGENFVTAAQHVLPHGLGRDVRIAGLGEIAVRCSADKATFTLRIEPAQRLGIGNNWGEWCARSLIDAWPAPAPALLAAALPAATALIAAASSVVTVIALAMLSTATFALLLAAAGLRIVRRLLL